MLKTNSKEVMNEMIEHVKEYYNTVDDLKADLNAALPGYPVYRQACRLVESGCFLVYNNDIFNFLVVLLDEDNDEVEKYFDKSFDLYKHLIAKACEKLVRGANKCKF